MNKNTKRKIKTPFTICIMISLLATATKLHEIDQKIKNLGKTFGKIDQSLQSVNEELSKLAQQVEKQHQSVLHLKEELNDIKTDLSELDKDVNELEYTTNIYEELKKSPSELEIMYQNLIELREKLNTKTSSNTLGIGDFVNLIDEDIKVYKDISMEFAEHSYYGTSEIRLIQEIIMEKDGIITNINNMDDYEILTSLGFQTIGYTLVNQYSLTENGNIETELRCEKEFVKQIK